MLRYVWLGVLWAGVAGVAGAQDITPTPRVGEIRWPDGPTATSSGDSRLTQASTVRLPVRIPRGFLKFRSFELVGEPLQYVASVEADWGSLQMFGTRIVHDLPGEPPADPAGAVSENFSEQSVEVGDQSYGAAYVLRIECRRPGDDRCTKSGYARDLLRTARIIGGVRDADPPPQPTLPPAGGPVATSSATTGFVWSKPGLLTVSRGVGNTSSVVYAPGIRFPIEEAPAYLGSMVYGYGGQHGPEKGASWKDPRNYRFPWEDNFCEARPYVTSMCPSGKGHQGVDMRPKTPAKKTYWAVAAEDGTIGSAKGYSVSLLGKSGSRYDYLHLEMGLLKVRAGQAIKAGDRIGLISDNFGGTVTPVHLHFEIRQNVSGKGVVPVPPYMSLVRAYERM